MDEGTKNVHLTSAEISNLWSVYINDSLVICIVAHFIKTAEDPEVLPLLEKATEIANSHLRDIAELFGREGIAVPKGFAISEHVNLSAPRLFSDIFYMEYIMHMSKFGLLSHSAAMSSSSKTEIRSLFQAYIEQACDLNNSITELMIKKGVYIRPPYMTYPNDVDFVDNQRFLSGFWGKKRPLLAIEATHLFITSLHNQVGKSTLLGFAQVAGQSELKNYFLRGADLSSKIIGEVHDLFLESDVPQAMTWDTNVSDSTTPPYSDQLMLFLVMSLSQLGLSAYGTALSLSLRRDLGGLYVNFQLRALAYSEDGANLMIDRGWLEQPPMFLDREELAKGE